MISEELPLLLASASPRRQEILSSMGIPFFVRSVDVDESVLPNEQPQAYVARVTELKVTAALKQLRISGSSVAGVLAADTTVTLGRRILGKPRNSKDARDMIGALVGRTHVVLTAYSIVGGDGEGRARVVETEVTMRAASSEELDAYVQTGEGLDKAGAYGIQGKASFLVESISGSYPSVVGLPICELIEDLKALRLLEHYP